MPTATAPLPVAVLLAPMATAPVPVAVLGSPIATAPSPLAVCIRPSATAPEPEVTVDCEPPAIEPGPAVALTVDALPIATVDAAAATVLTP